MPNEVYARTRDGLATLVSPRAATRVLDDALRRSGLSADGLAPDAVHDLLMGPVRVELEGILPHGSLRRTLRRMARTVRAETRGSGPARRARTLVTPVPRGRARALTPPLANDSQRVYRSSVHLPDVPGIEARDAAASQPAGAAQEGAPPVGAGTAHAAASLTDVPSTTSHATPAGVATLDPAPAHTPASARMSIEAGRRRHHPTLVPADPGPAWPSAIPPKLDSATLERVVLGYAALDGVVQVAAVRARGEAEFARGSGVDTRELAPLLRTSVRLLGRHGRLRSLVLEHVGGLLFVFPLGSDTIVVLTRPSINIGAVFAARTALEEGL